MNFLILAALNRYTQIHRYTHTHTVYLLKLRNSLSVIEKAEHLTSYSLLVWMWYNKLGNIVWKFFIKLKMHINNQWFESKLFTQEIYSFDHTNLTALQSLYTMWRKNLCWTGCQRKPLQKYFSPEAWLAGRNNSYKS